MDDQQSTTLNVTNVFSSTLIGPFKSDLDVCLYLVQHPNIIDLTLSIIKAGGQESIVTQRKVDKFNTLSNRIFGCYRDYNASLRCELRKLVPEFIRKHNRFLKHYMDVTDVQKTFEDQPENIAKFTNFIQLAFNLFVQENLSDEDVIEEVKDLNYLTIDMKVFTADRKNYLQQLDIKSLLKLD
ncbi:hypothetical protein C2G38_2225275 [Gigaspora rosea]|uniref:Uncharacterized protein n=1 Tax=Gigaspora rosea TaxID=44941 RepID=A0A397U2J9_9GLOM|nr:hypothetical protein C2G38_2225275 [Gigaspora rosea]